jgi:hypothetical protein
MRLKRTDPPRSAGGYDTGVERPSPDEVRRAVKALVLGLLLGTVLLLIARRSRRG